MDKHIWFSFIIILPMLWAWISKALWPHRVSWKEALLHMAIVPIVAAIFYYPFLFGKSADIEVWNGEVTGKEKVRVSCEHSYECNCFYTTDSKGNSTRHCSTCYEHWNDWDWRVYSNVNDYENIRRIDEQGSNEPPRWTAVQIGEPYSDEKHFINHIKGAPDSLFNNKDLVTRYQSLIPEYPNNIYDYYRVDRVLAVGVKVPDLPLWNYNLSVILKKLGPQKKANVVIVLVNTSQVEYAKALKEAWLGGKKNDTVITIGSTQYPKIDFVDVFSWSTKQSFNVELRDEILSIGTLDRAKIINAIDKQVKVGFNKRSMDEFAYLKEALTPPMWLVITICLVSLTISFGISWLTYHEQIL